MQNFTQNGNNVIYQQYYPKLHIFFILILYLDGLPNTDVSYNFTENKISAIYDSKSRRFTEQRNSRQKLIYYYLMKLKKRILQTSNC